ncbi:MAG: hypothetical protein ABI641_12545 [Caldimonas sp.]
MNGDCASIAHRTLSRAGALLAAAALVSCGGGSTGTDRDSGVNKTYLSVDATDADGDALQYQWRVTAGTIDNRNARETVWTMPDGPGLHFAYVKISDGKGGWVEQQYAVSTDTFDIGAPALAPVSHAAPAVVAIDGAQVRLRVALPRDGTLFQPSGAGAPQSRVVYVPDVAIQVLKAGTLVFAGSTDLRGEVDLPKLEKGAAYVVRCSTQPGAPLVDCSSFTMTTDEASVRGIEPALTTARNLRLFGHIALADGAACGTDDAFFGVQTAASVQLRLADGTTIGSPVRVNRYGDYAVDAAVPATAALTLDVACEGYAKSLDVPASTDPAGYVSDQPIELSHAIGNARPRVVKMVANGPEGNVRGRMIVAGSGTGSNTLPGSDHFLTYKGQDTKLGACQYYRALGAVKDCDAQGNMIEPISFDDWKRLNGFGTAADVAANYINKRDLNLVRRMVATRSASGGIAFYVCNSPGPDGTTQQEVDDVMEDGIGELKKVACVTMEWTSTTGANGGLPFTKFFTFSPTGQLLLSINLDGRGEKYMPGTCVACHGGSTYNGRFPEQPGASAYLGSRFLPFDTGNYLFSSKAALTESAQSESIYQLNQLVADTDPAPDTATRRLVQGWYASSHVLDKTYVPQPWRDADAAPATAGAARVYHEVIGTSCRTCHVSLGDKFDWDSIVLTPARASTQVCGGTPDLALNASMPNALISSDLLNDRVRSDAGLAALMTQFLGCSAPLPDPVYAKR